MANLFFHLMVVVVNCWSSFVISWNVLFYVNLVVRD